MRNLVCQSDSLEAITITLIEMADIAYHLYGNVISDVRMMLEMDSQVELIHVLREGNQVADYMTKLGARSEFSWKLFQQAPVGVSSDMLADFCLLYLQFSIFKNN